ncbi:MAG: acylphosphatase [Nitrospirae bacterium]|nr:acylphosphatase [Nitrospirota bacterium]
MIYNNSVNKRSVTLRIKGFVQGVFFRASAKDMADGLGLTGWVRNLPDGSVEAFFEGEEGKLKEALDWCRHGPPGARVKEVIEKWSEYCGESDAFRIRRGY